MEVVFNLARKKAPIEETEISVQLDAEAEIQLEDLDVSWTNKVVIEVLQYINPLLEIGDYVDHTVLKPSIYSALCYLQGIREKVGSAKAIQIDVSTQDNQLIYQLIALFKGFLDTCTEELSVEIRNNITKVRKSIFSVLLPEGNTDYNLASFPVPDTDQYIGKKLLKIQKEEGIHSPKSVKESFLEALEGNSMSLQCQKILQNVDLYPQEKLQVGEREFFISQVCDATDKQTSYESVLYTMEKGQMVVRLCWYSGYMGAWYVSDAYEDTMHINEKSKKVIMHSLYKKGTGKSYTQEMKCCHEIDMALQERYALQETQLKVVIHDYFYIVVPKGGIRLEDNYINNPEISLQNKHSSLEKEMNIHHLSSVFKKACKYPPGSSLNKDRLNIARINTDVNSFSKQILPDFSSNPIYKQESVPHIKGKTTVEAYSVLHGGCNVIWEMQYNERGDVWVRHIYDADSEVNSFGVHTDVIDSGAITNKPVEYLDQSMQIALSLDLDILSDRQLHFADITKVLDEFVPIIEFRKKRNIQRKEKLPVLI